jgi:ribosome recycling factor
MSDFNKDNLTKDLQRVEDEFLKDLRDLRTGRVSPETFNNIPVEAYGTVSPLQSYGNVSVLNALMVVVNLYDRNVGNDVVKAITAAGLGLNPSNEGDKVNIPIPAITGESRLETVKKMKVHLENARIAVREVRKKYLHKIENMEGVSEDEQTRLEKSVQKEIDAINTKLQELAVKKEKEITEI